MFGKLGIIMAVIADTLANTQVADTLAKTQEQTGKVQEQSQGTPLWVWILIVLLVAVVAYEVYKYFNKQKQTPSPANDPYEAIKMMVESGNIKQKNVDGTLSMDLVRGWFRGHKLDNNCHIPFLANPQKFSSVMGAKQSNMLVLGIYDEQKDKVVDAIVVSSADWDESIKQTIGNDKLVKLN